MTKSLLIDAMMPTSFWLDAIYSTVFTINYLPTLILQGKSPYEVLFRRMPDYSFPKHFGCSYFPNFVALDLLHVSFWGMPPITRVTIVLTISQVVF